MTFGYFSRKTLLPAALLAALIPSCARHQNPPPDPVVNAPSPSVTRDGDLLVNEEGWPLPDVTQCKRKGERTNVTYPWNARKDIFAITYNPCEIQAPYINTDGRADPIKRVNIKNVSVYDIEGREFCYRTLLINVPQPGEAWIGVVFYQTYYDLDGDGKYEAWDSSVDAFNSHW
jgi:hypothetical protein